MINLAKKDSIAGTRVKVFYPPAEQDVAMLNCSGLFTVLYWHRDGSLGTCALILFAVTGSAN
jgi:hypothetical protein